MATPAERQRAYRARHTSGDGTRTIVNLMIDGHAYLALKQLARHKGMNLAKLVEALATSAENRAVARMSAPAQKVYHDGEGDPRPLLVPPGAHPATQYKKSTR